MNVMGLLVLLVPGIVYGVCPLCTLAVGAGVGLSRWLAIDDLISGLWIGALLLSLSLWVIKWLRSKKMPISSNWSLLVIITLVYLFTIIPLYWTGLIGNPANRCCGTDRLLVGIALGSITFLGGMVIHACVKIWRGHVLIPFQKIIIPTTLLTIVSLTIYLVIRR